MKSVLKSVLICNNRKTMHALMVGLLILTGLICFQKYLEVINFQNINIQFKKIVKV